MDNQKQKIAGSDILKTNITYYDEFAHHFEKIPFEEILIRLFNKYSKNVKGKDLLDIGSGPGSLALWVKGQGFSPLCLDPSKEMCLRCREKGLSAITATIEEFELTAPSQFDQILALSSLIHIEAKKLPAVIGKIHNFLANKGVFYVTFLLGGSEGWEDPTHSGKMRYFSRLSKADIFDIIAPYFSVVEQLEVPVERMSSHFLLLVLEKKGEKNED